ncbi:MAG: response regulator transcription factor [Verrucomicrobiota bacterium]|jgi:DNA-binding NarL/FixJ family response regulator
MARQQIDPVPMIRVFLVDDEPVVRRGLQMLLSAQPNFVVCGGAATEGEALAGILTQRPDVAVVDLSLKEGSGLSLINQLHQRCAAVKILVFSMHNQVHYAAGAFAAGAHGYVLKEEGAESVIDAVQAVLRGERYLSEQIAAKAPGLVSRTAPQGRKRAS